MIAAGLLLAASAGWQPLFDGSTLNGWHMDVPARDSDASVRKPFIVREGKLVSLGTPGGHLITDREHRDYRLAVEYRFVRQAGNCGVLVHASTPRRLYGMFPQSIEVQMQSGQAGDFWVIGEDITVPDMEARRGPRDRWGVDGDKNRRILNLNDGMENPLGSWNRMLIECRGRTISVWVNGVLVNRGFDCTVDRGKIAIQAEGVEVEFRRIDLLPLS